MMLIILILHDLPVCHFALYEMLLGSRVKCLVVSYFAGILYNAYVFYGIPAFIN